VPAGPQSVQEGRRRDHVFVRDSTIIKQVHSAVVTSTRSHSHALERSRCVLRRGRSIYATNERTVGFIHSDGRRACVRRLELKLHAFNSFFRRRFQMNMHAHLISIWNPGNVICVKLKQKLFRDVSFDMWYSRSIHPSQ
jgi:hypothetical protein